MAIFGEFKKFAMRGNVVDLAIGVVIGAAFTGIVNSLVKDIITPPIGWMTGGLDFSNLFLTLKGPHLGTLANAQKAGAITMNYGIFLNTILTFVIIAIVLFLLVRQINKLKSPEPETPDAPPEDILLLREIRDALRAEQPR